MQDLSFLILLLPLLLLLFLVFSNRRRVRAQEDFQRSVVVGDEVVSISGLYGTVVGAEDQIVSLEIAKGVVVRVDRRAIGMRAPGSANPEVTN
ncbi:MAG: preprotein translocase subunit YajC [Actinomycetia bacterium]|nr:preprotein translocase subunit YajC [Actinomycetes bacterium]